MIGGSAMLAYRFPGSFEENQQLPIKYECASFGPKYAFSIANAIDLCIYSIYGRSHEILIRQTYSAVTVL
jgi:hypothetical protein